MRERLRERERAREEFVYFWSFCVRSVLLHGVMMAVWGLFMFTMLVKGLGLLGDRTNGREYQLV